jgi:RimJ/RimL family protein N-acetyltransferase
MDHWPNNYQAWPNLEVFSNGVFVRPIRWSDREKIRIWRNQQMKNLRQRSAISPAEQNHYFKFTIAPQFQMERPPQILFGIEKQNLLVAYGGITNIRWIDQHAELSFVASDEFGCESNYEEILTAFLSALRLFCNSQIPIRRLFTETYAHRLSHIALLEKLSFAYEGTLKQHSLINGTFVDSIIHGLIWD